MGQTVPIGSKMVALFPHYYKTTVWLISKFSRLKQQLRVLTNCFVMSKISFSSSNTEKLVFIIRNWSGWWKHWGHI